MSQAVRCSRQPQLSSRLPPGASSREKRLLCAIPARKPHGSHLRAARHVVFTNLIGQGLGQSQSKARDLIDATRPAERGNIQFQFRIERRGLRLLLLQLFELEAQINALEVLKNVEHAAKRDYTAERSRLVKILQLHRLHV